MLRTWQRLFQVRASSEHTALGYVHTRRVCAVVFQPCSPYLRPGLAPNRPPSNQCERVPMVQLRALLKPACAQYLPSAPTPDHMLLNLQFLNSLPSSTLQAWARSQHPDMTRKAHHAGSLSSLSSLICPSPYTSCAAATNRASWFDL